MLLCVGERATTIKHFSTQKQHQQKKPLTIVWKQECSWTRNGGFWDKANTLFSTMVHSTSSSWMIISFLRILIANRSSVPLRSASITCTNWLSISVLETYLLRLNEFCKYIYFAERTFSQHHQKIEVSWSNQIFFRHIVW